MKLKEARKMALIAANDLQSQQAFILVEVAGSIRRMKPEVKDIELIARTYWAPHVDMFGEDSGVVLPHEEVNITEIFKAKKRIKNGQRYKQFDLGKIKLDLFIVFPPASWGVIKLIRTGSADFSRKCVTQSGNGGYLKDGYRVKGGSLWQYGFENNQVVEKMIAITTEKDFFEYLTIDYIEPEKR